MGEAVERAEAILRAVYRKDLAVLQRLDPSGVNCLDEDGRTPLMHAVLAAEPDPAIVRLLIERGADVNASEPDQHWTALHLAARDQHAIIVRVLLETGAAVDPIDVFGNTPLWRCVMTAASDLTALRCLIAYGADPSKKNNFGISPIDIARTANRADIVSAIEASGRAPRHRPGASTPMCPAEPPSPPRASSANRELSTCASPLPEAYEVVEDGF
jgi:ankyrin repeat protein